jgi:ATP-dependent RNA helicase DDX31/DBP7
LRQCWYDNCKVVLFVRTTATVDFLEKLFGAATWPGERSNALATKKRTATLFGGWPLYRLHGSVQQAERLATYKAFHGTKTGLLVCSDVAARGLDLPGVNWIIQYDPPAEISDYVHRIGRTARRGEPGSSLIFLSPSEQQFLSTLELHGLQLKRLSLEATLQRAFSLNASVQALLHGKNLEASAMKLQLHLEGQVSASEELKDSALQAFRSFMRGYSAQGALKHIFQVRALHLGHVARSFALENSPATMPTEERGGDGKKRKQIRDVATKRDRELDDDATGNINTKKIPPPSKKKKKDKEGGVGVPVAIKSKKRWVASAADYI